MMLGRQLQAQGGFLFRWRSFLPLLLVFPAMAAFLNSDSVEIHFGEVAGDAWMVLCLTISLAGQAWRSLTVGSVPGGTSGRNTTEQSADVLNTTGVYSLCRNPLYFGNFVVVFGFALAIETWWLALIVLLSFALYYERIIIAEEAYLDGKFGAAFRAWSKETPSFLPRLTTGLAGWRPSMQPFSLRKVLRKEYNGYALILITFPAIDFLSDLIGEGKSPLTWIGEDLPWACVAASGLLLLIVFRSLKRHTRLLDVMDR
jgi:protein-S-isoprenylcysteine O-methyltransferase Ste14